jgi:hypothetical protein
MIISEVADEMITPKGKIGSASGAACSFAMAHPDGSVLDLISSISQLLWGIRAFQKKLHFSYINRPQITAWMNF